MGEKVKKKASALFIQRVGAFLIDVIIIYFLASMISYPFLDKEKVVDYNNQLSEYVEKLATEDFDMEEYLPQYEYLYYQTAQANGITSFVVIVLGVLYYIVFQTYQNGQTIGKKIMKIRVVSLDGDLFMNQMIFRSMLANSIIFNLITFVFLVFSSKRVFFYNSILITLLEYLVFIISVLMVMFRKDGCALHDKLVHTRVIRED